MPRIFDEFVQGDETSARFGGVGLGLFIAAILVRAHDGRIWAESAGRDKGATFHLELPVRTPSEPIPAPIAQESPAAALRILLVEDHQPTRKTIAETLTQRGHTVSQAESIAQARILAKGNAFHIVICDLGLPDGRGYDLMRELKEKFSLPGIALTGYGMEDDIQQSREAGFSAHLTKPVELAALEQAIRRAVMS